MKYFFKTAWSLVFAHTAFLSTLHAESNHEEIVVHLNVAEPLVPLYLGAFHIDSESVQSDYAQSLYKILAFDIELCGRIALLAQQTDKESILKNPNFKEAFANPIWKNEHVSYVIQGIVVKNLCSVMIYSVDFANIKHLKDLPLTGHLSSDRKQIHKIADAIHKTLFNRNGIASTRILYATQTLNTNTTLERKFQSEIWECDYDGGNARQLTKEGHYCITPAFFPTKKNKDPQFLYVSYKQGPAKIFLSSLENPHAEPLISLRGNQLLPAISRDRSKLAFICDAGGRADLFVQSIHPERGLLGKPVQAYSFPASVQASPTFSPDGKKIAFVSDKDGTPRIYMMNTPHYSLGRDLPAVICLTKKNKENTCPNWSPDGKKIAYSANTDGIRQIWIYDCQTQEEKQLTSGKAHKENPCWAPNSLHIVFNTADINSSELYLVNLSEAKPIKITDGPGKKHYPSWQPE
jgi:TolB protein